jgi:hypothetical protein
MSEKIPGLSVEFLAPPEPDPEPEPEPDFASDHQSLTFSDQMPGGPEHARDPDSPKGLAGADEKFGSFLNG